MHEMRVNCGWNSVLWLFFLVYVLYVMHLSPCKVHDSVFALTLWSFFPLVYKLYNQNPKIPILLNCIYWDCVGLLFHSLRTISGTNTRNMTCKNLHNNVRSLIRYKPLSCKTTNCESRRTSRERTPCEMASRNNSITTLYS